MKRVQEWFQITCIHRDDLIQAGFDGDSVDDSTMERLACKMCDDYVEQLFWIHMDIIAEDLGISKLRSQKESDDDEYDI